MKKFVINLKRRSDRKELFEKNNLENYTYIDGVDGHAINMQTLIDGGWHIDTRWRDPFKNRKLQNGEVGCTLSHYTAWKMIAQMDEPAIIMEDDCWIKNPERYNEQEVENLLDKYDIVYLQHNENEPGLEKVIDDNLVEPYYPYNLTAYAMYPDTAKLIIEKFGRTLIPSDEHIPKLIMNGTLTSVGYTESPENPQPCYQHFRSEVSSDIEVGEDNTFRDFTNVHFTTIGTDRHKLVDLNDSAIHHGIFLKNLGNNFDWFSPMTHRDGGKKVYLQKEFINQLPPTDLVFFTDGYDSLICDDEETIVNRFLEMKADVIFSGENSCWPNAEWANRFDETQPFPYLNSGGFIGRAGVLQDIISHYDENVHDDDQAFYQEQFFKNEWDIIIDNTGYLFQTADKDIATLDNQLYNPNTNSCPLIYHANGDNDFNYSTLQDVKAKLFPVNFPQLYLPTHNEYHILDRDMLLVKFMNQSQCERLIEMGNKLNTWEPMPGDKFPAQEIRMKELGLFEELESHWQKHLYPLIERYWHPMEMYGLRDAFIMKYSVDTQKDLPLHTDASLVTGSVKLNEDYEGADLVFPRQGISNKEIPPGWCILFPGSVTHGHECTELLKGTKYSLTMWSSRYTGDKY